VHQETMRHCKEEGYLFGLFCIEAVAEGILRFRTEVEALCVGGGSVDRGKALRLNFPWLKVGWIAIGNGRGENRGVQGLVQREWLPHGLTQGLLASWGERKEYVLSCWGFGRLVCKRNRRRGGGLNCVNRREDRVRGGVTSVSSDQ